MRFRLAAACAVCCATFMAFAASPARAEVSADAYLQQAAQRVAALEVHPAKIELDRPLAYAQVLVTAVLDGGERVDVTRLAERSLTGGVVTIDGGGLVRSAKDGAGAIRFTFGGKTADVPITIAHHDAPPRASFVQDVLPAMSKMGCNAGTCHGSKDGKNGFKLSLRGYDPVYDHRALTDDIAGRRFNRAAPEQSLMLLKTTGGVPHVGGAVDRARRTLLRAIEKMDR